MSTPSVTNTFTASTTILSSKVNQNFTDIINALTDGAKDLAIATLTCTSLTTTGNNILGNAAADSLVVNATIGSNLIFTDNTYDIGASGATRPKNGYFAGSLAIGGGSAANNTLFVSSNVFTIRGGTSGFSLTNVSDVSTFGITNAGAITAGVAGESHTLNGLLTVTTTSHQATAVDSSGSGTISRILVRSTHAVTPGNIGYVLSQTAGEQFHIGVDTASSNALVFGNSTTIGTNIRGSITPSGKWTLGTSAGTQAHAVNGSLNLTKFVSTAKSDVATSATINQLSSATGIIRLTGSTATALNGIAAGVDGQHLTIHNVSSAVITVAHESGSATAADRITSPSASSITIGAGDSLILIYDSGSSRWIPNLNANATAAARTRSTGTSVGIGGVAISNSSGAFTTTSASYVDVTNLSVTITTSGRPIMIKLIPDNSANASSVGVFDATENLNAPSGFFKLVRGASDVGIVEVILERTTAASSGEFVLRVPPSSVCFIDAQSAGTYTYKLQAIQNDATVRVDVFYCKLMAYEL